MTETQDRFSKKRQIRRPVPALLAVASISIALAGQPVSGRSFPARMALDRPPGLAGEPYVSTFLPVVLLDGWQVPEWPLGTQLIWSEDGVDQADLAGWGGAAWVRIPLRWEEIEPVNAIPENYRWPSSYEAILRQVAARGMRLILTLERNPAWASSIPGGPIDDPLGLGIDNGELVEFLVAAVERYGIPPYGVKHWEIYNEPDNKDPLRSYVGGWGCFGQWPDKYAELLEAIYDPIKAADPDALILLGGLAYDRWDTEDPPGPFAESFLDDVLALGGGAFFDVMNFHYYPVFGEKWEAYGQGPGIIGKTAFIRAKLLAWALDKPVLCTETSMWSDSALPPDDPWHGSDELQSRHLVQVYVRSAVAGLDQIIWFKFADDDSDEEYKYGLVDADLTPKPAYHALETLTNQLSRADFLGPASLPAGVEAYEFRDRDTGRLVVVAWSRDELQHWVAFLAGQLTLVDKYGLESWVSDSDDGASDGQIWVPVTPSPIYIRLP